ncbi:hypothetical protein [Pseudonocardia spirodelae]|uniref:Uncharacterized protein n=1 Tax=Pseudonocardia spirodelae TaxID=3133431 RepID=A0ABU8TB60_9PSEU
MTGRDVLRALDTQSRLLGRLEAATEALLAERDPGPPTSRPAPAAGFDDLLRDGDRARAEQGWTEVDLLAALTSEQRAALDTWAAHRRISWGADDLAVVGLAVALGVAATVLDTRLDDAVRSGLGRLRHTRTVRGWERRGRGLPIDHTGTGFGGPDHRIRSAGHDLARPLAALRQLLRGEFTGYRWEHGVRRRVVTPPGAYTPSASFAAALGDWAAHLAADVVTPMGLPLPGMTWLAQAPDRAVRTFAQTAYRGDSRGGGLNLRSGALTPALVVLAVETVVRTHVHARAAAATGGAELTPAGRAQREELLLVAHGAVAAASCGRAAAAGLSGGPAVPVAAARAARHVNVPALVRSGALAAGVHADARARARTRAPGWSELAARTS